MLYTLKVRLYAGMHVYVLTQEGLIENSMAKVVNLPAMGDYNRPGTFLPGLLTIEELRVMTSL